VINSTSGLSEPIKYIGGELLSFDERVPATPLIFNGGSERRPTAQNQANPFLEYFHSSVRNMQYCIAFSANNYQ
jgi:hypothetical protein